MDKETGRKWDKIVLYPLAVLGVIWVIGMILALVFGVDLFWFIDGPLLQ